MHVIVLTCVALKAVGVRQYIQFALIGGNVLAALVNLPFQTVRLADRLDLFDKTLVADKEEEYAENKARDSVFVHYPTIEPRVLVKIFPDLLCGMADIAGELNARVARILQSRQTPRRPFPE